ncbi:hypothetical protein SK128_016393 [Halocaridina rubra]|uniref:SHSP domain-containing protein n=1 Tax=Halocaridina rubra TaxID=373956 RepID=A0AAN9A7B8_HALRR
MVCENRRLRSLLVSRRGGFLEDPFFRDAWGDYNNAVRRIVDRFNHGMFTPSDRLRDSHYHSIYRTLRSARINYAAQAARFKDEGDHYKLVMDVREFVGGEITVRTAGGSLSVRGRLESGAEETGGADSIYSGMSRGSSSARTIHRRFNLPPDADGEKVQSTLSRDAVLTVTLGKRNDVRVIPVTVEGQTPPPSEFGTASGMSSGTATGTGRSGTKRHSATQPEPLSESGAASGISAGIASGTGRIGTKRHSATQPEPGPTPSKRSQESNHDSERDKRDRSNTRNRRERFGMERNKEDEKENTYEWKRKDETDRDKINRRGSGVYTGLDSKRDGDDTRRKSYPSASTRQTAEEISQKYLGRRSQEHESRRRVRDNVDEELEPGQRTRKRTSKYEEAKEFHIPIRFEGSEDSNVIFQYPSTSRENLQVNKEQGAIGRKREVDQSEVLKSFKEDKDFESTPYSSSLLTKMEREKECASKAEKSQPLEKDTSNMQKNLMQDKENIKPSKDETPWVYSKLYERNQSTENSQLNDSTKSRDSKAPEERKRYYFGGAQFSDDTNEAVNVNVTPPEDNKDTVKEAAAKETRIIATFGRKDDVKKDNLTPANDDSKNQKDYLRTQSIESDSTGSGRKSPVEGREVIVEKKQSDMEGDMFKDCWQNFSSTLQEVLMRLQELSSELGPPRQQVPPSTSLPKAKDELEAGDIKESSQEIARNRELNWDHKKKARLRLIQ